MSALSRSSVAWVCRRASRVRAEAILPVAPSSVAEKKSVWRLAGVWATIRSTAGLKPMSSMRSASSRTRMRTRSS